MPYLVERAKGFRKDVKRLCGRNAALGALLEKKLLQVQEFPHHFKPLRAPLQDLRRAHVAGCFVLVFEIDEAARAVRLLRFRHHDDAYGVR